MPRCCRPISVEHLQCPTRKSCSRTRGGVGGEIVRPNLKGGPSARRQRGHAARHPQKPGIRESKVRSPSRSMRGPTAERNKCGSVAANRMTSSDPSTSRLRSTSLGLNCMGQENGIHPKGGENGLCKLWQKQRFLGPNISALQCLRSTMLYDEPGHQRKAPKCARTSGSTDSALHTISACRPLGNGIRDENLYGFSDIWSK